MMNFRILKQSIIDDVLVPAEQGRYVTAGYQKQRRSADEINANRQVTVYYSEGDIPKGAGQAYGDVNHDIAFRVELAVATPAKVDLSVLHDENATEADKATALRQMLEAGPVADEQMDELIDVIFQVLMDARNEQLGINPPDDRPNLKAVSNRWIDQIRKDTPVPEGEYLILAASMRLSCRIEETITGEDLPAVTDNAVYDSDIVLDGNEEAQQGVGINLP